MILKLTFYLAAIVVLAAGGLLGWHGAFSRVVVTERVAGPYEFVFRTAPQGDFAAVRRITTELETAFQSAGIRDMKPLDVFFPPGSTDQSQIGFTVATSDLARIATLPNPPLHRTIPAGQFLTTTLPYRSPFSFMIGFWRVDPQLRKYREANGLKQTWAATINEGSRILYLQPKESNGPGPRT